MIRNTRMKRFSIVSVVATVGALVFSTLPAQAADPGVSAKEIKLGYSGPLTGSAGQVYGKLPGAMKAYFDHINANGGVYGRKIKLISRDDKYLPTLAATQTTNLILNDKVFALVGALGTATHSKAYVAASLAKKNVPDLFVNTGFSGFADKAERAIQGWYEDQGQLKAMKGFMPVEADPSGGLISSAVDVAVLPLCMQQQLNKTSLRQMTTAGILRPHRWGEVYYGYGVQISQTAAGVEWSHSGYIPGYVSAFNYFPQHQLTLVVLENQSLDPQDLARAMYYHDKIRYSVIGLLSRNK